MYGIVFALRVVDWLFWHILVGEAPNVFSFQTAGFVFHIPETLIVVSEEITKSKTNKEDLQRITIFFK